MNSVFLILVVLGYGGGQHSTVTKIPMQNVAACQRAETQLQALHDSKMIPDTFVMTCVGTY